MRVGAERNEEGAEQEEEEEGAEQEQSSALWCTSAQIDERARARFGANAFLARLTTAGDPALGSRLPAGGRKVGQPAWAEPNPDWPSWRQSKSRNLSNLLGLCHPGHISPTWAGQHVVICLGPFLGGASLLKRHRWCPLTSNWSPLGPAPRLNVLE